MITKRQFDILTYLLESNKYRSQRDLAKKLKISLGTVNNDVKELSELKYVGKGKITDLGKQALKPFKVKRAIFIAAGFGSRLVPITLNTPKPLIRVNGKRIIETTLDAVIEAGIEEIYIVRGYLAEQFDLLLEKYPMIKFIDNLSYNESKSISSAIAIKDLFKNAYVFDGPIYLKNKELITPYQYSSNFLATYKERTDNLCLKLRNNKVVKQKLGGKNCYRMYKVSYWSEKDGEKIEKHLEKVYYSPGGKERYWDEVMLDKYINEYDISIRKCAEGDIVEIDSFRKLQGLDSTYEVQV